MEINYLDRSCRVISTSPPEQSNNNEPTVVSLLEIAENKVNNSFVLLGEPGMGKTRALNSFAEKVGGEYITANNFLIESATTINPEIFYCIDALDEARLNSNEGVLSAIFKIIRSSNLKYFGISCRIAEWTSSDKSALDYVTSQNFKELELLPLNESQQNQLLLTQNIHQPEQFLEQARQFGFKEMLGNPQSLEVLAYAFNRNQQRFPKNRKDAYKLACVSLLKEHNPIHRETKKISNTEKLLDIAGCLCSLLLLSNKNIILDLSKDQLADNVMELDEVVDLMPKDFSKEELIEVYKSKLFKKDAGYQPIHRSISEYLAARFLDKQLQNKTLLITRLNSLVLADNQHIVTNLRGLAGWLASLNTEFRKLILKLDPVSILDYGDLYLLNASAKQELIESLASWSQFYFKTAFYGRSQFFLPLASYEMQPYLIKWLADYVQLDKTGTTTNKDHLASLLVKAIAYQEKSSDEWTDILLKIIRTPKFASHIRRSALEAINKHANNKISIQKELIEEIYTKSLLDHNYELAGVILFNLYPTAISPSEIFNYSLFEFNFEIIGTTYQNFWQLYLSDLTPDNLLLEWMNTIKKNISSLLSTLLLNQNPNAFNDGIAELALRAIHLHGEKAATEDLSDWLSWCWEITQPELRLKSEKLAELESWQQAHPDLIKKVIAYRLRNLSCDFYLAGSFIISAKARPNNMGQFWCDQANSLFNDTTVENNIARCKACINMAFEHLIYVNPSEGIVLDAIENVVYSNEELLLHWNLINNEPLENNWKREHWIRQKSLNEKNLDVLNRRNKNIEYFLNHLEDIKSGKLLQYLHNAAWAMSSASYIKNSEHKWLLEQFKTSKALEAATNHGCMLILQQLTPQDAEQAFKSRETNKSLYKELPALLGAELLYKEAPQLLFNLSHEQLSTLLTFIFLSGFELPNWFFEFTHHNSELIEKQWLEVCLIQLKKISAKNTIRLPFVYALINDSRLTVMAEKLLPQLLSHWPVKFNQEKLSEFSEVLVGLIKHAPQELSLIIQNRLTKKSISKSQRIYLLMAGMWVDPAYFKEELKLLLGKSINERTAYLNCLDDLFLSRSYEKNLFNVNWSIDVLFLIFKFFAPLCTPAYPKTLHSATAVDNGRDFLNNIMLAFLKDLNLKGVELIEELLTDKSLELWHSNLQNILLQYRQRLANQQFKIPSPTAVANTLFNKSPSNHDDLMALLIDRLEQLQVKINNSDTNIRKLFWNTDGHSKCIEHKNETLCRDVIVEQLRIFFEPLRVNLNPETQHGDQNQSDFTLSYRFESEPEILLPVEVKGDWHKELFNASKNQLAKQYSSDPRCKFTGLYLVVWTGTEKYLKTPTGEKINNPQDLCLKLQSIADQISGFNLKVFVIDVTEPK